MKKILSKIKKIKLSVVFIIIMLFVFVIDFINRDLMRAINDALFILILIQGISIDRILKYIETLQKCVNTLQDIQIERYEKKKMNY